MELRLALASVIGREHIRLWGNNQDGCKAGSTQLVTPSGEETCFFGVVCDGCSEGRSNEVGAKLLSEFICEEIPLLLYAGTPLVELPQALYFRCVGFLRGIVGQTVTGSQARITQFIKDFLLCTVVGFIANKTECIIFTAGDGLIVVNDDIRRINQNNRPSYIGYHLVDRAYLTEQNGKMATNFETQVFPMSSVDHLAICSDGFEEALAGELWGHLSSLELSRTLKGFSRRDLHFPDDCSVIVLERIDAKEESDAEGTN